MVYAICLRATCTEPTAVPTKTGTHQAALRTYAPITTGDQEENRSPSVPTTVTNGAAMQMPRTSIAVKSHPNHAHSSGSRTAKHTRRSAANRQIQRLSSRLSLASQLAVAAASPREHPAHHSRPSHHLAAQTTHRQAHRLPRMPSPRSQEVSRPDLRESLR